MNLIALNLAIQSGSLKEETLWIRPEVVGAVQENHNPDWTTIYTTCGVFVVAAPLNRVIDILRQASGSALL